MYLQNELDNNVPLAARLKKPLLYLLAIIGYMVTYALFKAGSQIKGASFPYSIEKEIIDEVGETLRQAGESISWVTDPFAQSINLLVAAIETSLMTLPWITVVFVICSVAAKFSGFKLAGFCLGSLTFITLLGLWNSLLITASLIVTSVALSLGIGIPLGIIVALNSRAERLIRPLLDVMQVMPSFVYLIPALVLFGVGSAVSIALTVIYSIPPSIRLTNLGIRTVPIEPLETAFSHGATRFQTLLHVQLPLAKPSIMMGVNQTIMMALAMVIITAVVGSDGLGRDVWYALRTINTGTGLEAGLAIVVLAVLLDRLSYAITSRSRVGTSPTPSTLFSVIYKLLPQKVTNLAGVATIRLFGFGLLTLLVSASAQVFSLSELPLSWHFSFADPVNDAVGWATVNLYFITSWLRDSVIREFALGPTANLLTAIPWWLFFIAAVGIAYTRRGKWVAMLTLVGSLFLSITGIWDEAMETLSQVLTAVALATIVGISIGILTSQSKLLASWLKPVLDTMQTMPVFVYLIPVIMLWGAGPVASVIATVIYAMPSAIRMTDLGIRLVSSEFIETAQSYGATRWQILRQIQIPIATPTIMLGINQCVMMTLAMVIVGGLVGGGGLGQEVYVATLYLRMGDGLVSGFGIVFLAIVLDRITQPNQAAPRKEVIM